MRIDQLPDLEAVSREGAEAFGRFAREAVGVRGVFHVALSGGSTPRRMFQLLAEEKAGRVPWDFVHLWWGDERTVAPDHADSNYRMTREALIAPLGLDPARVHRIHGESHDHAAAAADYEAELVAALGSPPVLDLAIQGMGPDGHTASLFPGSPALSETQRFVVANPVDSPVANGKTVRLTMTATVLNAARQIIFLVAGADKADALAAVLEGPRDSQTYPSQLIHGGETATWFVDNAAAAKLRSHP